MNRKEKEQAVTDIREKIGNKNFVLTEFGGISVQQLETLRAKLRAASSDFTVVKNTMLSIAFRGLGVEHVESALKNTTAITIQHSDAFDGIKVLCDFAKENEKCKIKIGRVGGMILGINDIRKIAMLPSKNVLVATLLSCLVAPMSRLVYALQSPMTRLVYALNAVKTAKQN